jgi:site-specific recombinase XerD
MRDKLAPAPALPPALAAVAAQARDYIQDAKATSTLRAYGSDWRHFVGWCEQHQLPSLPASPETVGLYVTVLAETHKVATLQRRLSAISVAHQAAGHESPTKHVVVRTVMAGIRRTKGTAQTGKAPLLTPELKQLVAALPEGKLGLRDRALLLLGFAGAFRRSELVALDVADLQFGRDGLTVTLRKSKTDQEGAGQKKGIPYGSNPDTCPVRAVQDWITAAVLKEGPLFRPLNRHGQIKAQRLSDRAVARVVQRAAESAGLDAAQYAGHSLRAGLATAAAQAGVSERVIMQQTGHRSLPVLRKYIREGSLFRENAAAQVGL